VNSYWIAAIVSLWLLTTVVGVAQLGLLSKVAPLLSDGHSHGPIELQDGLAVGQPAGEFAAVDRTGAIVGLDALRGHPTVVLFLSAGCQPCQRLAAELRASGDPWSPGSLVVITNHDDRINLPDWVIVLRQHDMSAAAAFGTYATPHAFALDEATTVTAKTVPVSVAHLKELAHTATGQPAPAP